MAIATITRPVTTINDGFGAYNDTVTGILVEHTAAGTHGVVTATSIAADNLASGRVVLTSTSGLLVTDSDITFDTDTLTVAKIDGVTELTLALGSDADGDIYYRASGTLARLAKGTATHVLTMNAGGTAPEWAAAAGTIDISGTPVTNDYARWTDADTLEGREVSEVFTDLGLNSALANLTTTEITELEAIGDTTISAAQWGYLGAMAAPYKEINIPAGAWNYPAANPAPLERDTGTNSGMFRHLFDDTTEEFILLEPAFELPDNLDASGTVYFSLYGYAVVADGNEVQFKISHSAKTEGESWDAAYGTLDSGDKVTNSDQDEIDQIEWNETVSNLGWTASDLLRLMLSRIAIDDGTKTDGDYGVLNLKIRIPVT